MLPMFVEEFSYPWLFLGLSIIANSNFSICCAIVDLWFCNTTLAEELAKR